MPVLRNPIPSSLCGPYDSKPLVLVDVVTAVWWLLEARGAVGDTPVFTVIEGTVGVAVVAPVGVGNAASSVVINMGNFTWVDGISPSPRPAPLLSLRWEEKLGSGDEIVMWFILWWKPIPMVLILSKIFFAGVSSFAALGFLLYGGSLSRLFLMLQRFPVESKGQCKKLLEVGYVTTICFSCFLIRCFMICFNAFDKAADLDVLNHPILNFLYYLLVEILPSSLVLFILRKLPPKRGITQYHPIR
ncbi:hypothetical protein GIB67_006309 [Kingdonia uniflora]|uniref:THH1/TOM1/TOM3 domain-containing protein n=1 Tax=Kingdonia uniflora TaxID=39325 RepID=A0A7J7P5C6_9MAGN|nr:hypothetical protein GIB67_006309 [Kingdonia uniflora]